MYRSVEFDQIRTERYGPFVIVTASVRSTLRYFTLVLAGSRASKICTVSVFVAVMQLNSQPLFGSIKGSNFVVGIKMISLIHSRMYTKLFQGFSHVSTTYSGRSNDVQPATPLNRACRANVVLPNRLGSEPSILYSLAKRSRSILFSSFVGL